MGWVTLTLRKRVLKQSHAEYQMRDLQISRERRQLARKKQYETAVIQYNQNEALAPVRQDYDAVIDELDKKRKALTEYLRLAKAWLDDDSENNIRITNEGNFVFEICEQGEYAVIDNELYNKAEDEDEPAELLRYRELQLVPDGENEDEQYLAYGNKIVGNGDGGGIEYAVYQKIDEVQRADLYDFRDLMGEYGFIKNIEDISEDDISTIESSINSELSNIQLDREDAQLHYSEQTNYYKTIYENEKQVLEESVNDEETMLNLEQSDVESQMEAISQEMQSVSETVSSEIQNSTIKLA